VVITVRDIATRIGGNLGYPVQSDNDLILVSQCIRDALKALNDREPQLEQIDSVVLSPVPSGDPTAPYGTNANPIEAFLPADFGTLKPLGVTIERRDELITNIYNQTNAVKLVPLSEAIRNWPNFAYNRNGQAQNGYYYQPECCVVPPDTESVDKLYKLRVLGFTAIDTGSPPGTQYRVVYSKDLLRCESWPDSFEQLIRYGATVKMLSSPSVVRMLQLPPEQLADLRKQAISEYEQEKNRMTGRDSRKQESVHIFTGPRQRWRNRR
jgi:hypothetical protein